MPLRCTSTTNRGPSGAIRTKEKMKKIIFITASAALVAAAVISTKRFIDQKIEAGD